MRKLIFISAAWLSVLAPLPAELPADTDIEMILDESKQVDSLIQATKESLSRLENIKKLITELKATEKLCMKNPKDGKLLFKLAQAGQATYTAIQEAHLEDFFRSEFITEIKKLHDLASKKTIPPAK